MKDKDTRDAFHTMVQERNELVKRTKKTQRNAEESDSSSLSSDGESEDDDALKKKGVKKIKEAMDSDSDSGDESGSDGESSGEDEGVIKMDFGEENKPGAKKEVKK